MAVSNKHKVLSPSNLNIIGLSEDVSPDTATDYLATYDASAGTNKRVLLDNLGLGGGNSFTIIQTDSGTSPTADSSTDTLTLTTSNGLTTVGDSSTDSVSINLNFATITVDNTPTDNSLAYIPYYEGGNHRNINISSLLALGGGGGSGDVTGPASSTDNAIARFDGTTGKIIQDYTSSAPTISDTGVPSFKNASYNFSQRVGELATAGAVGATSFGYNAISLTSGTSIGALTKGGSSATAIGYFAGKSAVTHFTAVGSSAGTSTGSYAVNVGFNAQASATNSIAIGSSSSASTNEVVIGANSSSTSTGSTILGNSATVTGVNSVLVGYDTASSANCVAIGYQADASTGGNATAVGFQADATGAVGTAIGYLATATGASAVAIGGNTTASATSAVAIGDGATADTAQSIAIGTNSDSNSYTESFCIGNASQSQANNSAVFGSANARFSNWFVGSGVAENNASLPDFTIQTTSPKTGTNLAGPDFIINGTESTGSGLGGSIILKTVEAGTTGTTQNTTKNPMLEVNSESEVILNAEDSATADASLWAGSLSFYLDESGNTVTVKAKYADGTTVKTGTIALT